MLDLFNSYANQMNLSIMKQNRSIQLNKLANIKYLR